MRVTMVIAVTSKARALRITNAARQSVGRFEFRLMTWWR